ncbi:MAG: DUF2339 domain-containing protein, partial [Myxococcota bacterium]|nr:DUF2339 domain-containing protein [Myxococcota bacterium]
MRWIFILGLVGTLAAGCADDDFFLFGGIVGAVLGWLVGTTKRRDQLVDGLQARVQALEQLDRERPPAAVDSVVEDRDVEPEGVERAAPELEQGQPLPEGVASAEDPVEGEPPVEIEPPVAEAEPLPKLAPMPPAAPERDIVGEILSRVRDFFLGGNTVVRVGLLVLLVGVVMLLKYAADNAMFPVELRLASSAALGIALIAFGFRQRTDRPGFSQTLQGGGLAALYLVVFFGLRVYDLIPVVPAFALLVAVVVLGGALAVLQDALPLIVIALIGGFSAPIVASTGSGNHVAL